MLDFGYFQGGSGGKCSCNATDILAVIKENDFFRETIRGPPGMPGKEGKTGAPGLTVSDFFLHPLLFSSVNLTYKCRDIFYNKKNKDILKYL